MSLSWLSLQTTYKYIGWGVFVIRFTESDKPKDKRKKSDEVKKQHASIKITDLSSNYSHHDCFMWGGNAMNHVPEHCHIIVKNGKFVFIRMII